MNLDNRGGRLAACFCLMLSLQLGVTATAMAQEGTQRKVVERIVARVNDDIITLTEYNNEMMKIRNELARVYQGEELEKNFDKQRQNALENLIQNKLLVQKAKELGFGNKIDLEVSSYVENFRKQNGIPDMRSMEQALNQAGMTMGMWREEIKNSILQEALIGTFVQSKVVTTDEEIQKYYDAHKPEYTKPAEVEIAEIVFYLEGNKDTDVQAKADDALSRLKKGENFSELAKKVSEGPTAKDGGNIGSFKFGTMAPEIQKAVFTLSAGQTTDILKSKFGYQIIKVLAKNEAEPIPIAEVKKNIQSKIYYDKYKPLLERFLKEVREESYVEIYKDSLNPPPPVAEKKP